MKEEHVYIYTRIGKKITPDRENSAAKYLKKRLKYAIRNCMLGTRQKKKMSTNTLRHFFFLLCIRRQ